MIKKKVKEGDSLLHTACCRQERTTVSTNTGLLSAERADMK